MLFSPKPRQTGADSKLLRIFASTPKSISIMKHLPQTAMLALFLLVSCRETGSERCAREAEEADRQCPRLIDVNTQIDSIRYQSEGNKFCYYYSLTGGTDAELKAAVDSPDNRRQTLHSLTNTAEMRYYLEHGVTFEYVYYSQMTKAPLGVITISPEDYR